MQFTSLRKNKSILQHSWPRNKFLIVNLMGLHINEIYFWKNNCPGLCSQTYYQTVLRSLNRTRVLEDTHISFTNAWLLLFEKCHEALLQRVFKKFTEMCIRKNLFMYFKKMCSNKLSFKLSFQGECLITYLHSIPEVNTSF